ncbi:hypothetical protein [Maritalea sp. S77]|uniref:hypothetical protein n=1 Tax=Maritalea sp. S77 TaxID=3415125 RepID=UPI003C7C5608
MGFYVATAYNTQESMIAASERYLSTSNSGEAINQGMLLVMAGMVPGLLAKIAKNMRR